MTVDMPAEKAPSVDNIPETPSKSIDLPAAEATAPVVEKPAKKPVDPFQKRIGKMHAKHQSEIAALQAEVAEARKTLAEVQKSVPKTEKEYANAEEYLKDKVKELVAEEKKADVEVAKAEEAKKPSPVDVEWSNTLKQYFTDNPDVDVEDWRLGAEQLEKSANDHVGDFAKESDVGAQLLNEILTNDEHIEKLNSLKGRKREKYLSQLEDKIESGLNSEVSTSVDRPVEEKKPALPKPPTPNRGKAGPVEMTLEEAAKKTDLKDYFKILKAKKAAKKH